MDKGISKKNKELHNEVEDLNGQIERLKEKKLGFKSSFIICVEYFWRKAYLIFWVIQVFIIMVLVI